MRKIVSAVDMEWLSDRADALLLAHFTKTFPVPKTVLNAGMTKHAGRCKNVIPKQNNRIFITD